MRVPATDVAAALPFAAPALSLPAPPPVHAAADVIVSAIEAIVMNRRLGDMALDGEGALLPPLTMQRSGATVEVRACREIGYPNLASIAARMSSSDLPCLCSRYTSLPSP